jgi:protease-4
MVEWNGLVSNQMFLRGMLDRWGVEPVLIRVGTFKSAAENITERQMSPANREQIGTMLNDMWNHILNGIAEARGRSAAELDSAASRFTVVTAQDAINVGLVDGVRFDDQIRATLRAKLGLGAEDDIRTIGYADYAEAQAQNAKFHENKIAVIYAVGEINYGAGDANTIGNLTLCRQIREAAEDDKVKAIVLRVNSPGGSALASDMIWREILQAKAKKPVIASMGDVAASGGYYISAPCDRILAEPTTITGSIGVIGLLMNTQKFFTNELGITFDRVYSNDNRYADLGNPNRPMSDYERERIQLGVNQIYRDFLTVVANGRGFANADSVDRIAQGRVWSGLRALELKLVDELGGLDRAIAIAAERANMQEYRVVEIPRQREGLEAFFEGMKERRERDNELDAQATANGAANPAAAAERHLAQRYLPAQARTALNLLRVFTADPRGLYYHTGISVSID